MTDLVIGGRRHNPQRVIRTVMLGVALLVVAFVVGYFIYQRSVAYEHPDGSAPAGRVEVVSGDDGAIALRYAGSSASRVGELTVLRLTGAPASIGAAHGRFVGATLVEATRPFSPSIEATVKDSGWFSGWTRGVRLRWRHRFLDDGIPGHQLVEIANVLRGAARGGDATPGYEDFVRAQAALDLGVAAPVSGERSSRTLARSLSFVAPMRGPSGDRLLVGRSFALPGTGDGGAAAARDVTVSFVHADGVLAYASVGWPGLVGVVSGINAEGIAIMVHPVHASDVRATRSAQPIALLARDVLENARTLDEAISVIEHNPPLGAAAFVIVDGNARTWAVVERSPTRVAVTRAPAQAVVTDLLAGAPFAEDLEIDWARRVSPAVMRGKRAEQLLRRPLDDIAAAAAVLRDRRDASDSALPAGHRGALDDPSAQAALFDASGMVLWVSEGRGARGRFRAFDLRYELRGEGARPAPPADVPAAVDDDPRADQIIAARAELRQARAARAAGSRDRAADLVSRALGRVPTLPEARLLAGELARSRGDDEGARRWFGAFLDGGADDLGAEDELRAYLGTHLTPQTR